MESVGVNTEEKTVTTERCFAGLIANVEHSKLIVQYRENLIVDGKVIASTMKEYSRDFEFWKASQLGQAIVELVNTDLAQADPSSPRNLI